MLNHGQEPVGVDYSSHVWSIDGVRGVRGANLWTAKELADLDPQGTVTPVVCHVFLASLHDVPGQVPADFLVESPGKEVALELLAGEGVDMGCIPSDASQVRDADVHVDAASPEPDVQPNMNDVGGGASKWHAVHQEHVLGDFVEILVLNHGVVQLWIDASRHCVAWLLTVC